MKTNILSTIRRALRAGAVVFAVAQENADAEGFGNALSFNGVNRYVSVPTFGSIAPTTGVTVEFWALARLLAAGRLVSGNESGIVPLTVEELRAAREQAGAAQPQ